MGGPESAQYGKEGIEVRDPDTLRRLFYHDGGKGGFVDRGNCHDASARRDTQVTELRWGQRPQIGPDGRSAVVEFMTLPAAAHAHGIEEQSAALFGQRRQFPPGRLR